MRVEVYADVVFFINFIMDFFIFWIVGKLIRRKIKLRRILLGAFVTATLYCLLIFIPVLRAFYNFAAALFILMAGIMAAFYPKSLGEFAKLVFLAHVSAFSVGGLGIALFYYTNISTMVGNFLSIGIENFSFKVLLASISLAYIVIKLALGRLRKTIVKKQTFYTIRIHCDGDDLSINTLLDTGNSLNDPLSSMPVIIAEFNAVKNLLPDSLKLVFYENKENNLTNVLENIQGDSIEKRIRMIPFASLGKQNGMIIGFKPDLVEVYNEDNTIYVTDCIIGIYNYALSGDGAYQGLLNPEVLQS